MGYLIFQILFFLLIAALLGFVIGWLLRGSRFDGELKDLDARWRSKLGEVEGERDRFAGEVTQANESRAKSETSAAEAKRLAETHEASLDQLRREHQTNLSALSDVEKRVGGLEGDLSARTKELAEAKASMSGGKTGGGDTQQLGKELAAATARTETLEQDLQKAKEANGACKREVERLEARIADLQRTGAGAEGGGSALGRTGPSGATGSSASSSTTGTGGGALGLVGGTDSVGGDRTESSDASGGGVSGGAGGSGEVGDSAGPGGSGSSQKAAASPSQLAETSDQGLAGASGSASSGGGGDDEGVRPEILSQARGGVADDLKKISGVGPKLEKTLNGLGIYHFAQIAAFTPDNAAWVDRRLRFKGRIDREKWIDQAKVLAGGGDTEFSRRD